MRNINRLLRKNKREIDRSMNQLQPLKKKTENLIKTSVKGNDLRSARLYARELVNINRQYNKLHLSKARLDSITMSINEQWSMNKLTDSMKSLTGIMKDVNQLINLGVVLGTMQELQKELTKAGIINEMMEDMTDLDVEDEELESESQDEIDKIIQNLSESKFSKVEETPKNKLDNEKEEPQTIVEDNEEQEALDEMRERLKALQE